MMDNLDDSENNAKISDSAYSNSFSNSQSRKSHSSKSTLSGSNSSGSSGYGGQLSTSSSSNNFAQPPKKELKKKKQTLIVPVTAKVLNKVECGPQESASLAVPEEAKLDDIDTPSNDEQEKGAENMDISSSDRNSDKEETTSSENQQNVTTNVETSRPNILSYSDGFSCVISMHDGVVMYTTSSLTSTLGFPKDMWIGRSFIDFVHPRDRNTFASQITSGLAVPKIVNGTQDKAQSLSSPGTTMVCRIRRYRSLTNGFGVKERVVTFMPFLLKFAFKNINDEEGKLIYLVIQATPFFSAFKTPCELLTKVNPFMTRHSANGNLEYIDTESVPYLGYLPQDVQDKDALQLYHPEDLEYLQEVYETIVKEGGLSRSKPYRMMTQNGDYIKVETEWSSFINPWSKKLEFVIGKHHIIEGPANPDVFQSQDPEKIPKLTEEQQTKAQICRDNIIKIMNEALTKPAEVAKQQMSKRCQDLATFMENLMEEQPKIDEELRLEIQDPEHSYYERDSVMLGGISPHHDYNDSRSSTETPLNYNQINYNETLQRYFDSHQAFTSEDSNTKSAPSNFLSPMAQNSGELTELTSSCEPNGLAVGGVSPVNSLGDYQPVRLTESLINKHDTEMKKVLMKTHRENRCNSKGEREKTSNETRQKKKEHLARCNALFQPTAVGVPVVDQLQPHGVKRSSKQIESEAGSHKHHCPSPRAARRRHTTSAAPVQPSSTLTTSIAVTNWPTVSNPAGNLNTFILGVGIPQQMSLMNPVPAVTGMFPMYYAPVTAATPTPSTSGNMGQEATPAQFATPAVQCVMYGQPMYGSPFMYSPMTPQASYPVPQNMVQQSMMQQNLQFNNTMNHLCLTNSNYEEACRTIIVPRTTTSRRDKNRAEVKPSNIDHGSSNSNSSTYAVNRNTDPAFATTPSRETKTKMGRLGNNEEVVDRTDGESSYSSFYSSFFKTESGSAEESGDAKNKDTKNRNKFWDKHNRGDDAMSLLSSTEAPTNSDHHQTKVARRKMDPPWVEQVCVTSELVYKYQIMSKTMEEVLKADKQRINNFEQPSLVNEQLGQLYLDLQLEGVAARLTLEEGVTSSSSSGEETSSAPRRKREYSKLVMIYEENAPLPPPADENIPESSLVVS